MIDEIGHAAAVSHRRVVWPIAALLVFAMVVAACGSTADDVLEASPTATPATAIGEPDAPTSSGDETTVLDTFTATDLRSFGLEAIGCWFTSDDGDESAFFAGFDGNGFILVGGEAILLEPEFDSAPIYENGPPTSYTGADYAVNLENVGEPTAASIEATEQGATLIVIGPDGFELNNDGLLWCGV